MNQFGELLRQYRQSCNDPMLPGRRLSQERLGELLGEEMNIRPGYSGAAISDWERGKSKIHADQRLILLSLINVFRRLGAIESTFQANQLLEAGNYRALDITELRKLSFEEPDPPFVVSTIPTNDPKQVSQPITGNLFSISKDEMQMLLEQAKVGPQPWWPRVFVAILRKVSNRWSASLVLRPLLWLWVALLAKWLLLPSLQWPFVNQDESVLVMKIYVGGSFIIPLLFGLLTDTSHDAFWKEHDLANAPMTRLYTYQGAGIGFHLGYFGVFALNILRFYAGLPLTTWMEWMAVIIILTLGYVGARLVPYNLWQVYKRLSLADGWIFFIFLVIGPFFSFIFLEFYSFLTASVTSGLMILSAITIFVLILAWQHYCRVPIQ